MPTYGYVCTDCGHDFEIVQAISDSALTACPQCGGVLRKVFHPVGVAFKGSGFYRTDSRAAAEGGSSGNGKDSSAPDSSGADSGSKTAATTKKGDGSGAADSGGSSEGKSSAGGDTKPAAPKKPSGSSARESSRGADKSGTSQSSS